MKRYLAALILLFACHLSATTVTGTIQDTNGNRYSNGTVSAFSVITGASMTPAATDANGTFSITLAPSTYQFTVCAKPVNIGPNGGTSVTQVCAQPATPIVISGGSQDVSTQINAVAPILGPSVAAFLGANNAFTGNNTHAGTETMNGQTTFNGLVSLTNILTGSGSAAIAGTFGGSPTMTGNWTLSGNNSFTGSNTFSDLITSSTPVVDVRAFGTLAGAMANALPCKATGCVVLIPSGYRETITTAVNLGSATKPVLVWMMPDSQLTCNITAGNVVGSGDCFTVHTASGFRCMTAGANGTGAPMTGLCDISLSPTASVRTLITTGETGAGGQTSMVLHGMTFEGGSGTATIGLTMVNLEGLLGLSEIEDNYVIRWSNAIGLLVRSNANSGPVVVGPLTLKNWWIDGSHNAGARPLVIQCNTNGINPMDIIGGVYHHPGSGQSNIEINGSNCPIFGMRNIRIKTYAENLANGNSKLIKIIDAQGVTIENMNFIEQDTDTAIDISETAQGKSANIHAYAIQVESPTNLGTHINNHITGEVIGGLGFQNDPMYNFCNLEAAAQCAPFTISSSVINFKDTAGVAQFVYDRGQTNPFHFGSNTEFKNSADATQVIDFNPGLTAAQNFQMNWKDRGTSILQLQMAAAHNLGLFDVANSNAVRMNVVPGSNSEFSAAGSGAVQHGVRAGTGTGGVQIGEGTFGSFTTSAASACEATFGITTLGTGATTTDTTNNCLPANAVIKAVVYRITTTITTAANFTIGDATTAGRFCAAQSVLTAGTTGVCFVQADQTGAAGPRQTSAAKVRVTSNVNPGAGAIRLIVYYQTWSAPTS